MASIELKEVSKEFGEVKALDSVSLKVEPGEIFGFLGPNGAGKSTAIRCILGSIFPNQGTIKVIDEVISKKSYKFKSQIGYVPSDDHLERNWSGEKHIQFVSKARSLDSDPSELIARLGINTKKKIKDLSTGNKQKLSILLALMHNPKILILDEPTRGLDPLLQEEIYEVLNEFKLQGNSVFFSSHILSEVERLCDRVAIIRNGKIVANENMDSIKKIQVHLAEITFSREIPMEELIQFGEMQTITESKVSLKIKGDINPLIHFLSSQELIDLDIGHASLEDTFLHYYEDKK